ncbi:MAG: M14 family zinc carboxypeptidase, partial [Verrucomicrobia bacterium]|nr:M14 family zinc carboxypeptidase [Verrucomicrobiota bacterium]
PGVPVSNRTICKVSENGKDWQTIETHIENDDQLVFEVEMPESHLFIAHVEPYRISDLEALKREIVDHPLVDIHEIGSTVQGRLLEIIRIGKDDAPYRVFLRGRAHPWEPGGNWVIQGLIKSLLKENSENQTYLNQYAVYILPMANKDGVAAGKTRFNMMGMDLNRKWDKPADPVLCPENHYLENWFQKMINRGTPIHMAMDLHNDQSGRIHVSRPNIDLDAYLERMRRYETLMRQHTWFTEGSTGGSFRNPGTIGEGLLERYGITAFVQELNANWIEGLQQHTSGKNWELLGSQMRRVFFEFFLAESTPSEP